MGSLANSGLKTQMKCCIMWHLIGVCTVCLEKNKFSKKEIQYFCKILTCGPSVYTMQHSDFIVHVLMIIALWKIPLVLKGLNR